MKLAYRGYLLFQLCAASVSNAVVNWGLGWLMFHRLASVPLTGDLSMLADIVGTCVFLPFLSCAVTTPIVRWDLRKGRVGALTWRRETHRALRILPRNTWYRGGVLGLVATAVVAPALYAAMVAGSIEAMPSRSYIVVKTVLGVGLGLLVTPVIVVWALADPSE